MTQETQATQAPVELEIVDIVNATKIIKAALERSAFQAEELSQVAGVFDKFNAFVAQAEANAKAAQAEAENGAGNPGDAE